MNAMHIALALLSLLIALPSASFGMTGKEWYEACSELEVATPEQRANASPERKVKYRMCQIEASRAFCDIGFEGDLGDVYAEMTESQKEQFNNKIMQACPTVWSMPGNRPHVAIVRELEKNGGPGLIEGWLPASRMLREALRRRWPSCEALKSRYGLVVEPEECLDSWIKMVY
ncbi:MAG: hypothetical protein OZ935_13670 [Pseudomonadota bacterium]|nr:hypothetical protein [Pseudomonadota bacterium]